MSELPIVLHVGAPKAGSSALQYDLTWNPRRALTGDRDVWCEYVAIDAAANLLRGDALDAFASLFAARYCMSADLESLVGPGAERLRAAAGALAAMRAGGTMPVMSYELWLHAPQELVHRFTLALAAPVRVVVYVRDPVSWLRSRYWQRRGRMDRPRGDWIADRIGNCRWAEHVARWRSAPGVVGVDVRLADGSVPHDFAALVGFGPPSADARHNPSVPGEMARYLERHEVPPELHVSEAKFAWSRWTAAAGVEDAFDPTPPTFDADDIRTIVEGTSASSAALLPHCDDDVRSRIVADARWWSSDPEVHAGRPPRHPPSAPVDEADRLLAAALQALVSADGAWRAEERRRRLAEDTIARLEACLADSGRRERDLESRLGDGAPDGQALPAAPRRRGPMETLRALWRRSA